MFVIDMEEKKRRIKNYIFSFIRKFNIQTRLLLAFILLSVIPLFVASIIIYRNISLALHTNTYEYLNQLLLSIKVNIDNSFKTYINEMNNITTNIEIVNNLSKYKNESVIEKSKLAERTVEKIRSMVTGRGNPISIELINDEGYITYTPYKITADNIEDSILYKECSRSKDRINWYIKNEVENKHLPYNDGSCYIIATVRINDYEKGNIIGWAIFAFDINILDKSLRNTILNTNSKIFISDEHDNIIMLSNMRPEQKTTQVLENINSIVEKKKTNNSDRNGFVTNINKCEYYIYFTILENTNWKLISFVEYDHIISNVKQTGHYILVIMFIAIIVVIPITFIITSSIVEPTKRIISSMKEFQEKNLDVTIEDNNNDEIAFLAHAFNNMSRRIKKLINEVYITRLKQANAELKALQSQINPHFLYNTLDSIGWLAYISENKTICTIIDSLATFYRLSLNKGNQYYTIAQEVEHVKSYIKIQEILYNNQVKFHFDIPDDVLPYETIKLILQPLVENALKHGIEPKGGIGNVTISIKKNDGIISMKVIDNGKGIGEYNNPESLPKANKTGRSGYGIKNINERIKISYGEKYNLTLRNNPNGGTIAEVIIPAIIEGDDKNKTIDS
jgi:two-component system sensor histidine kinase YesM